MPDPSIKKLFYNSYKPKPGEGWFNVSAVCVKVHSGIAGLTVAFSICTGTLIIQVITFALLDVVKSLVALIKRLPA